MTKEEWKEFVTALCNHKIKPKLRKIRRKFHPFEFYDRFPFGHNGIYNASRTIHFIEQNFEEDDDLTKVFNQEHLDNVLDNIKWSLEENNRLMLNTGISDVFEEFFDDISEGMDISDIPEIDFEALREAGSSDPKGEILLSIKRTKKISTTVGVKVVVT